MQKQELTKDQTKTLDFIANYIDKKDCAPTQKEIAKRFGLSESGVQSRLSYLKAKGWLSVNKKLKTRKLVIK